MEINIGIEKEQRENIAEGLSRLLADSYTLYLKTHNFHWNVTGPMFATLHTLFETHYSELALAVDEIAERIRAFFSCICIRCVSKSAEGSSFASLTKGNIDRAVRVTVS